MDGKLIKPNKGAERSTRREGLGAYELFHRSSRSGGTGLGLWMPKSFCRPFRISSLVPLIAQPQVPSRRRVLVGVADHPAQPMTGEEPPRLGRTS